MRDDLLSSTIATPTLGLLQATASARPVSLACCALSLAPDFLSANSGAIDLASVAATANDHLATAARTYKKPRRRHVGRLAAVEVWTNSAIGETMPWHSCAARCGARHRSRLGSWGRRRARCVKPGRLLSGADAPTSLAEALTRASCGYVDNAARCPHTHRATAAASD